MKKQQWISLLILSVFVLALALVAVFAWQPIMRLKDNPEQFRGWVRDVGWPARLAFIGVVILQLVVAVIPGEPLEFAAGYAFGAAEGTILCLAGTFLGALLVFSLVRKFGVKLIGAFFSTEKINEMKFLKNSGNLNLLIFILFFIPGTPKDILTYVVPLTKANLWAYLLISNFARIPSVIGSAIAGGAAGTKDYSLVLIIYGVTALVSAAGLLAYRKIQKAHER